jgi:hypothetical protein
MNAVSKNPLFAPTPEEPIVEHALHYARNGWPVFPAPAGQKKSEKSAEHSNGRKWGQTTDADEIRRDFKRWPRANVGVVCGEVSGLFVVEIDTKAGHDVDGAASLAELEERYGPLPATLQAESPSGSVHYYFRHPGFKVKNSASEIGPGIDVRGDGGMVIAPPSVKPGKGVYKWRNDLPVADAPQWLLDRLKPAPRPELSISQRAAALVRPPVILDFNDAISPQLPDGFDDWVNEERQESAGHVEAYIKAALDGEYNEVARAPAGQRNARLNTSSLKLGHYVGAGLLDEKRVIDEMIGACAANGLLDEDGQAKCLASIASGLEAGKREPKQVPERTNKVVSITGKPIDSNDNVRPSKAMALTFFDDVEDVAKKEWIMKSAVAKGETSEWIAPPGMLKSALLTDLAVHIASGKEWRGYKSKEVAGVVYFALERADLVKRRLTAHRHRDELKGLPIAVAGGMIDLMQPQTVAMMVDTIRAAEAAFGRPVGFVVIDTLAKGVAAGGGDENQAKDLGRALANLRSVQDQTGVHVAIVSHTGKDEKRGARGSNSQVGDVDLLIQISGETVKTATVTKANDQKEGVLTSFKGEVYVIGVDEDNDDITTMIISADDCHGGDESKDTKAKLTAADRRAYDLLVKAVNDGGRSPPASLMLPHGVGRVVSLETWKDTCRRGSLTSGDGKDAFRKAFDRAVLALTNSRRIGVMDGFAWIAMAIPVPS